MVFGLFGGPKKTPDETYHYAVGDHLVTLKIQHVPGEKKKHSQDHAHCEITLPPINEPHDEFLLAEMRTRMHEALDYDLKFNEGARSFNANFPTPSEAHHIDTIKGALQRLERDYGTPEKFRAGYDEYRDEKHPPLTEHTTEHTIGGIGVTLIATEDPKNGMSTMVLHIPSRTQEGKLLTAIMIDRFKEALGKKAPLSNFASGSESLIILRRPSHVEHSPPIDHEGFSRVIAEAAADPTLAQEIENRKLGNKASIEGAQASTQEKEIERKAGAYITEAKAQVMAYLLAHEGELITKEHATELSNLVEQGLRQTAIRTTGLG